jgi:hypothetical protein
LELPHSGKPSTRAFPKLTTQPEQQYDNGLGHRITAADIEEKAIEQLRPCPKSADFSESVIAIYYKEHGVPHFHAKYAGRTGVFSIVDLNLIEGRLPKRVVALVLEWAFEHRDELLENWQRAVAQEPLQPIAPLE